MNNIELNISNENENDNDNDKTKPYVLHAEANAITKVAKSNNSSDCATLYVTSSPCMECSKLIIQAGAEFRFSILLTTLPVLTFSYGWAQSIEDYRNNVIPNSYFQLTLINPF